LREGKAGPQRADSAEQQKQRDRGDCEPISAPNLWGSSISISLAREFGFDLLATAPSVVYRVR
jgi:hypothetical protein